MELILLRAFQNQILLQSKFVLLTSADVNAGLKDGNIENVFYGLQNLLSAAANISKALWGQSGRLCEERRELRESIGVGDNSPLRTVVMRNNFDHFDERLDQWWKESPQHNLCDLNLMSRSAIVGIDDIDRFRAFDPKTTELAFWGEDFNIQDLVNEIQSILPRLTEEANKPHWRR